MDCNGARVLARRLERRQGQPGAALTPQPLATAGAAPIFHWFGIEPPHTGAETPGAEPREPAPVARTAE